MFWIILLLVSENWNKTDGPITTAWVAYKFDFVFIFKKLSKLDF